MAVLKAEKRRMNCQVSCSINSTVLWEVYKMAIREMCERIVNTHSPPDVGTQSITQSQKHNSFLQV